MASSTAIAPSRVVSPPWSDSVPGVGRRAVHHLVEPTEDRQSRQQPVGRRARPAPSPGRPCAARAAGRRSPARSPRPRPPPAGPSPSTRGHRRARRPTPTAQSSPHGTTSTRRLRSDTAPATPTTNAADHGQHDGGVEGPRRHDRGRGSSRSKARGQRQGQGQAGGDAEDDPGRGQEDGEHPARAGDRVARDRVLERRGDRAPGQQHVMPPGDDEGEVGRRHRQPARRAPRLKAPHAMTVARKPADGALVEVRQAAAPEGPRGIPHEQRREPRDEGGDQAGAEHDGDGSGEHAERAPHRPLGPEPRGPADLAQPRGRRLAVVAARRRGSRRTRAPRSAGRSPGRRAHDPQHGDRHAREPVVHWTAATAA